MKNHLKILEKIYKRKKGIPDAYKIDEIDVDSYFFYNFLDIFTKSNRIIRFSKGLEYAAFSIKKFEYEEFIAKQSFDFSSELHVSKSEFLFILNSIPDILEQHRNISQINFVPLPEPIPITKTSSLQSALYFHYYNDYNAVGVRIRFGIRLPNAYIQKLDSKNETFSEIDLKFDELEKIYQSLTFFGKLCHFISTKIDHFR